MKPTKTGATAGRMFRCAALNYPGPLLARLFNGRRRSQPASGALRQQQQLCQLLFLLRSLGDWHCRATLTGGELDSVRRGCGCGGARK